MKRWIAILLTVSMMFSLVACGKEQKADKYCTNCGSGMAKNDSFCAECGSAVGGTTMTSTIAGNSDEQTTTTSATIAESTTTTTQKQSKSTTTTAKKPATTTAKPITSTTTAKPTTPSTSAKSTTPTTTTHKHTYSKYVCTGCGKLDKDHAYEYLIELVKERGTAFSTSIAYDIYGNNSVDLCYAPDSNDLFVRFSQYDDDGTLLYFALYLDNYFYGATIGDCDVYGYIDAETFTSNSPLTNVSYDGSYNYKHYCIEKTRLAMNYLISVLNDIAEQSEGLDMTIEDLGFLSWK